ncbi:pituitary homeobox 1-like [Actinia tenebrosa]|uniref:Pituitary homeobox 1-like n=1 Tax=Actinia tenebrosa TaxID=6105 RepID=A0A6P8J5A2_ACTTE|nr:pituitary homeobox 1-like [Actinia tenebrosa]
MAEEMLDKNVSLMHKAEQSRSPGLLMIKTDYVQENQDLNGFKLEKKRCIRSGGDGDTPRKGNTPQTFQQNNAAERKRTVFTAAQKQELEQVFLNYRYPSRGLCEHLAEKFNKSYSSIKVWFKNHRARRTRAKAGPKTPNPTYSVYPWFSFCSTRYQSHGQSIPWCYNRRRGFIPEFLGTQHEQPSGFNPLESYPRLSINGDRRLIAMRGMDNEQRSSAFSLYTRKV